MSAFVQKVANQSNNTTSINNTLTGVASGSAILVLIGRSDTSDADMAISSVSDGTNTYNLIRNQPISGQRTADAYIALNVGSGNWTVTVTFAGTCSSTDLLLAEISGLTDTSVVDQVDSNTPSSGTNFPASATGLTSTQSNEFWFSFFVGPNHVVSSWESGYTDEAGTSRLSFGYQVRTSTGTSDGDLTTLHTESSMIGIMAMLKDATASTDIVSTFGTVSIVGWASTVQADVDTNIASDTYGVVTVVGWNTEVVVLSAQDILSTTWGQIVVKGWEPTTVVGQLDSNIVSGYGQIVVVGWASTVYQNLPTEISSTLGSVTIVGLNSEQAGLPPVVEAVGDLATANAVSTITPNLPTGTVDGSLLVALVAGLAGSSDTGDMSCTGWTHVGTAGGAGTGNPKVGILYKRATPAETAPTITLGSVSFSQIRARILRVSGYDVVSLSGASAASTIVTGSSSDRIHPAITTNVANTLQISTLMWIVNDATYTQPTGFTNHATDNRFAIDSEERTNSGSQGPDTGSGTSSSYALLTWALRPGSGIPNLAPTVAQDTADASKFSTNTPELLATGTDSDADGVRYNFQITDNPGGFTGGAAELEDSNETGTQFWIHPQPFASGDTWNGQIPVDDRLGQCFTGNGGILDKISLYVGDAADPAIDGNMLVRVYAITGTYGTSGGPVGYTDQDAAPTAGWLAVSESTLMVGAQSEGWYDFSFTGANRIRLLDGVYYFVGADWLANDRDTGNYPAWRAASSNPHSGNAFIDGNAAPNYGVQATWDAYFRVYEYYELYDVVSGTDPGFANKDTGPDSDPFISGDQVGYTLQTSLAGGVTWRWRVRVSDPNGSGFWSDWSTARTFNVPLNISSTLGTVQIVGYASTVQSGVAFNISSTLGTVAVTGYASSVVTSTDVNIDSTYAQVFVSGYDSTVQADVDTNINSTYEQITVTGWASAVQADVDTNISSTYGQITVQGWTSTVQADVDTNVSSTYGQIVVAGLASSVQVVPPAFTFVDSDVNSIYGTTTTIGLTVSVQEGDLIVVAGSSLDSLSLSSVSDGENSYLYRAQLQEPGGFAALRHAYCLSAATTNAALAITLTFASGEGRRNAAVGVFRPVSGKAVSLIGFATKETSFEASPFETASACSSDGDDNVIFATFQTNGGVTFSNQEFPAGTAADSVVTGDNARTSFYRIVASTFTNEEAETDASSGQAYSAEVLAFKAAAGTLISSGNYGTISVTSFASTVQADVDTNISSTYGQITVQGWASTVQADVDTSVSSTYRTVAVVGWPTTVQADVDTNISSTYGQIVTTGWPSTVQAAVDSNISSGASSVAVVAYQSTVQANQDWSIVSGNRGQVLATGWSSTVQAGTDTNVVSTLGTALVRGWASTVQADVDSNIASTYGTVAVTGWSSAVQADVDANISSATATILVIGWASTVQADVDTNLSSTYGTVEIATYQSTIQANQNWNIVSGSVGQALVKGWTSTIQTSVSTDITSGNYGQVGVVGWGSEVQANVDENITSTYATALIRGWASTVQAYVDSNIVSTYRTVDVVSYQSTIQANQDWPIVSGNAGQALVRGWASTVQAYTDTNVSSTYGSVLVVGYQSTAGLVYSVDSGYGSVVVRGWASVVQADVDSNVTSATYGVVALSSYQSTIQANQDWNISSGASVVLAIGYSSTVQADVDSNIVSTLGAVLVSGWASAIQADVDANVVSGNSRAVSVVGYASTIEAFTDTNLTSTAATVLVVGRQSTVQADVDVNVTSTFASVAVVGYVSTILPEIQTDVVSNRVQTVIVGYQSTVLADINVISGNAGSVLLSAYSTTAVTGYIQVRQVHSLTVEIETQAEFTLALNAIEAEEGIVVEINDDVTIDLELTG